MVKDVVSQKVQTGARRLLLVDEEVRPGKRRGQRGHVVEDVGFFEGHVADQPGGCADVKVSLKILHRAGAHGCRVDVGRAHDHLGTFSDSPSSAATSGRSGPRIAVGRLEIGQFLAIDARHLDQPVVVGHAVDVAVVGDPVQGDGVVRGRKLAGQPQVQVVLRLQELVRRAGRSRGSSCLMYRMWAMGSLPECPERRRSAASTASACGARSPRF